MKNISKKLSKTGRIAVFLLVLGTWCMHSMQNYEISERRAGYFIVKRDHNGEIKIGSRGHIFTARSKKAVGTFKVIDVFKDECLCVVESLDSGINSTDIRRVSFMKANDEPIEIASTPSEPGSERIIVSGIRFTQLSNHKEYYLSDKPVAVQEIEPLNISGIKNILYKIEKETKHRFSADLVGLEQINQLKLNKRLNLTDKSKIFLGVKAGKVGMIYEEGNAFLHMEISSDTLLKFKETMRFNIILKRK